MLKFFSILMFLSLFSKTSFSQLIKVGTSPDYQPFSFLEKGQNVGFEIDLINALATDIKFDYKVYSNEFGTLLPALNVDKFDIVISGMTKTAEREKHVDFSDCYYGTSFAFLSTDDKIKTKDDFVNKNVYVQTGSVMEKYAKKIQKNINFNIKSIADNRLIIEDMKAGRADVVILEDAVASEFQKHNVNLKKNILKETDEMNCYAIVFKKNTNIELRDKINNSLKKIKKNGTFDKIYKKWF